MLAETDKINVDIKEILDLQLRNLQTLIEIGVDKNTTVVFPGPLMSTIQEMGAFLARETGAVAKLAQPSSNGKVAPPAEMGAGPAPGA
jgi:hypothetical protein